MDRGRAPNGIGHLIILCLYERLSTGGNKVFVFLLLITPYYRQFQKMTTFKIISPA